jgi:ferredoxin
MRVELDRSRCTALGICEALAPDVFEINDEGELDVLKGELSEDDIRAVEEAVAGCPTEALKLLR